MEIADGTQLKATARFRPQVSLFSALIMMVLLAVIVGLAVKVWHLEQDNRALEMEREDLETEKSMLEYSIKKFKSL